MTPVIPVEKRRLIRLRDFRLGDVSSRSEAMNFVCSAKVLVKGNPNVSYICSRYYRAPELIFGATLYATAIGTPSFSILGRSCVSVDSFSLPSVLLFLSPPLPLSSSSSLV